MGNDESEVLGTDGDQTGPGLPSEPGLPWDAPDETDELARPEVAIATTTYTEGDEVDDPGAGADGRGRRRTAIIIVVVAILAGVGGMFIGDQIASPADRAAARAEPPPSLITVPVERQALSSELVLNGEVAYNEPTPIVLGGAVSIGAEDNAVVTRAPSVGEEINEGGVILEVTGRPVFVLQGELPMYRRMAIGTEGPDVTQLEAALVRLGLDIGGEPDPVFDAKTAAAVDQMYANAGFQSEGPSDDQQEEIKAAEAEVDNAKGVLNEARVGLNEAKAPMSASERMQLDHDRNEIRQAVPAAEAALKTVTQEQDQLVTAATQTRDNAVVAADAATNMLNSARNGAVDPDTGEPYDAAGIANLEGEVATARQAVTDAETAFDDAIRGRDGAIAEAKAAIADAKFNLQLSEAKYKEETANADTSALQKAVTEAEADLKEAEAELASLRAASGTQVAAGEIMFAPVLPTTVTESSTSVGAKAEGPLGTIATSETLVRARISRADSGLVSVGSEVEIEVREASATLPGSVLSVGAPAATGSDGEEGEGGPPGEGGGSGRLEVVVSPAEGNALNDYVFYGARVRVTIDSTDGEVLVVPVAALTVGPDEQDQVEIEVTPATDQAEAVTKVVPVTVGLSANGLAEVKPVEPDGLAEGDRVVIGFEWEGRKVGDNRDVGGEGDSSESDGSEDGGSEGDGGESGDDGGGDEEGDDGGGDEASSPLDALFGYNSDPVAERAQNLEIQETISECMKAEGFEYEPFDYSAQFDAQAPEEEWGSDAFGEKYGYGAMRIYELYEANPEEQMQDDVVDPNQEYVNGLGEDEMQAYYAALHGEMEETETADSVAPSLEEQGCYGKAHAEIAGPSPYDNPEFASEMENFETNVGDDPGLQELKQKWAACMESSLSDLDMSTSPQSPDDMYQAAELLKANALGQELIPFSSEEEAEEYQSPDADVFGMTYTSDDSGYVIVGQPKELSGEEIDAATKREVELWKADKACQDEVGYEDLKRQLEQEFVDRMLEKFPELAEG